MKKVMMFILVVMVATGLLADDPQTLVKGKTRNSFFGGPVLKVTQINGETCVLTGARLGWTINRAFSLGIAGYGLVNEVEPNMILTVPQNMEMGYGGLTLEAIINSNKVIHFTAGVLIGAGGVVLNDRINHDDTIEGHHHHRHIDWEDADVFFVAEPEVNLMVNVTRYFRIGFGVSYRFVNGIDSALTSNKDLSGFAGGLTFKFGKF